MRHFYIRLIMGVIWVIAAAVSLLTMNIPCLILYLVLGIRFFHSAITIREKEKNEGKCHEYFFK